MNKRRMKIPEPYRGAYGAAKKLGWEITRTGGGHLKWRPPVGRCFFTSATPNGGCRSVENDLRNLRRAGLSW